MISALYVESDTIYRDLGLDCWDAERDARAYAGPNPVVAHPPCKRWGRYWGGGPSAKVKRKLGDDGGCFSHALWAVRTFGGVIEHPEASHAWKWFGLARPPIDGGWVKADEFGGFTCCVEQGKYGHRARKLTWLYVCGIPEEDLPDLLWGRSPAGAYSRLDAGFHSNEERSSAQTTEVRARLSPKENLATPPYFAWMLRGLAMMVKHGD